MTGTSDRRLGLGAVADAGAQAWRRRLVLRVTQSWALLLAGSLGARTRAIALSAAALLVALLVGWGLAGAEDVEGDATPETALTLESATPTSLTVTWDDVSNATLYSVRWRLTEQTAFGPSYAATGGRYQITGLLPGRSYRVRLEVSGSSGVVFRILGGTWRTPLTAPEDLTVTAATASSLSLSWTKPDGWNPAGYQLRWRRPSYAQFQGSVKLSGSATGYTLSGLSDQTQYVVNLVARNASGDGSLDVAATAYAVDPLAITLTSSRELCTANTLTELTWAITGGLKPHRLFIGDQKIDLDNAESHRVNCGSLTIDPQTEEPLPNQTKTFLATVTDSQTTPDSSSDEAQVALSTPLQAPTPRAPAGGETYITSAWVSEDAHWAGVDTGHSEVRQAWWLNRWRAANASEWNYLLTQERGRKPISFVYFGGLTSGSTYEFSYAALRDPVEQLTPDSLAWSAIQRRTTTKVPTGVRATTTHNTVTVTWDDQPSAWNVYVNAVRVGATFGGGLSVGRDANPPNSATIVDLEPQTEYRLEVSVYGDNTQLLTTTLRVTTDAGPPGYQPPTRGAQNLTVTPTHESITLDWDVPTPNTSDRWFVTISHASVAHARTFWVRAPLRLTIDTLQPDTTYTIEVQHLDRYETEVSRTVTTTAAPPSGTRSPFAGGPPGPGTGT